MAENLLTDAGHEEGLPVWVSTQGVFSRITGPSKEGGHHGRFAANGTGNRNFQHSPMACLPGDVFSLDGYWRYNAGVARSVLVTCQFLDAGGAQTGNFLSTGVTVNGTWQRTVVENCLAPANTTQVRVQGRIVSAAVNDTVDFDDFWLNRGATLDRTVAPTPSISLFQWNGTQEVPVSLFELQANQSEAPVTLGFL